MIACYCSHKSVRCGVLPFPPMGIFLQWDVLMATCTFMDKPMAYGHKYTTSIILVGYAIFLCIIDANCY